MEGRGKVGGVNREYERECILVFDAPQLLS